MSGLITGGYLALAAVGGAVIGSQMSKPPKIAPPPAPTPPPQAAQTPDQAARRQQGAGSGGSGGYGPGRSSTMLTGAGGIDPGMLQLGKNSLLGQ